MIKKKFLLPDESFVNENPYLIATYLGGDYVAILFHSAAHSCGGGVTIELQASETGAEQQKINKCVAALQEIGVEPAELTVTISAARSSAGALGDAFDANLERLTGLLNQAGIQNVNPDLHQADGIKVYFKNWDNSLRIIEAGLPAYCGGGKPKTEGIIDVLIVDDSNLVQNILTRTIGQDENFNIVGAASDAFAATEKILESDPQVLILDVIMPQINGISFLANLMKFLPKPVIIFSTMGKTGGKIEQQAYDAGAVEVVDKKSLNLSDPNSITVIKEKIVSSSKYMVMRKEED